MKWNKKYVENIKFNQIVFLQKTSDFVGMN